MPRLTVSITEEQSDWLEEKSGESGEYDSKSEVVRECIKSYERVGVLEDELDRSRRERRQILEQREEHTELVRYVDEERTWREQPLSTRLRWWIFGRGG